MRVSCLVLLKHCVYQSVPGKQLLSLELVQQPSLSSVISRDVLCKMNGMVRPIAYLFAILTLDVSGQDSYKYLYGHVPTAFLDYRRTEIIRYEAVPQYPFKIGYYDWNKLHMLIALKNIPNDVNKVSYKLYNNGAETKSLKRYPQEKNKTILIFSTFKEEKTTISILLSRKSSQCTTKIIAEGRHLLKYNGFIDGSTDTGLCMDSDRPCIVEIDLQNRCEDIVTLEKHCYNLTNSFVCESPLMRIDTEHQWYQVYNNVSFIGLIPPIVAAKVKLTIKLEQFDNNTEVFSTLVEHGRMLATPMTKIMITNQTTEHYDAIQTYSDSTAVEFNCEEYLKLSKNMQILLANTENNKINAFNSSTYKNKLSLADNGTIICCLFYNSYDIETAKHLIRNVEKKTLLVYERSSIDVNSNEIITTHQPTNLEDPETGLSQNQSYTPYYIAVAVVMTVVILLIIITIATRCCGRKSAHESTLQLNTYATGRMLQYAELDNNDSNDYQVPYVLDSLSPYSEVIGVLKPADEDTSKDNALYANIGDSYAQQPDLAEEPTYTNISAINNST